MPDNHFILSSSWLPSLRFELRTLAGYKGFLGFEPRRVMFKVKGKLSPSEI